MTGDETKPILLALIRQLALDGKQSTYWRDRADRGIWHADEIEGWLSSLIDFNWTPENAASTAEPSGLGAVVEDAEGMVHVRAEGYVTNRWSNSKTGSRSAWHSIAQPVTVLSEGVTL